MRPTLVLGATIAALVALGSCATTESFSTGVEQIAHGQQVYAERCARCHGDGGQGTDKAPAVVGPTALPTQPPASRKHRTMPFHTAADIAGFVVENMPPKGARLSARDAYAVLAFALSVNGVDVVEPLDAENVGSIPIER